MTEPIKPITVPTAALRPPLVERVTQLRQEAAAAVNEQVKLVDAAKRGLEEARIGLGRILTVAVQLGFTADELAMETGLSASTVRKYISEERDVAEPT